MDRAEAIKRMTMCLDCTDCFTCAEHDHAIEALLEQESLAQATSEWISVEERLPKYGESVLITEGHAVFEASLSISHKWVRLGIGWAEGVTHWMPLPKPPKEGAEHGHQ